MVTNPLYVEVVEDDTHDVYRTLVVDDIRSVRFYTLTPDDEISNIYTSEMFTIKDDHYIADQCRLCNGDANLSGGGMRWKKGTPIIRFTSSGLEVT